MAEAKTSPMVISSTDTSVPGSAESTPKHTPRRKGIGAKSRDAEKFRFRKNQSFDKQRQTTLNEKFGRGSTTESLFGMPRLMTTRPPVKISISTKYVLELSQALIDMYRSACKIVTKESDVITLTMATIMQIEAKVWFAQQASPFATISVEVERRARRVKAVLPSALYPISFYIEQIGKVEYEHQIFIPHMIDMTYENLLDYAGQLGITPLPPGTIPLQQGNALTGARQWVRMLNEPELIEAGIIQQDGNRITFTEGFLASPSNFPWVGRMMIEPWHDVLPTFDSLVNNFNDLIGRVSRRVLEPISPVDYSTARGTVAQLTTTVPINDITSVEVYSSRYIDDEALVTGALLRFGYELEDQDDSHARDFRCVEAVVESAGALQRFIRNVTSKVR